MPTSPGSGASTGRCRGAGPNAKEFRVVHAPAKRISPRGSTPFDIEFRPNGAGLRTAEVKVRVGKETIRFAIAGIGEAR